MKVCVTSKKTLYHDTLGALRKGWSGEMDDKTALRYLAAGAVERYETKVIREVPFENAGEVEPSSVLPAAQVLPEKTPKVSKNGGKKKGYSRKA